MIVKLLNKKGNWINTDHILTLSEVKFDNGELKTEIKMIDGSTFLEQCSPELFLDDLRDIRKGTTYPNRKLNPYHPTESNH